MRKVKVITSLITTGSYEAMTNKIFALAQHNSSSCVYFANVHMLIESYDDPAFNEILNKADMATPDGAPLTVAMRLLYGINQERVAGMDMFPTLLEEAEKRNKSIFLYGGTDKVLRAIVDKAIKEFPRLKIAGYISPPFRVLQEWEKNEIIHTINTADPDLLFVSLGCPKQEKWAAEHKGKIHSCMLAVGGAFNVYAGEQQRAPAWMQRFSLEWLYRLVLEPNRLWKRYLVTNSKFIFLFVISLIRRKTARFLPVF